MSIQERLQMVMKMNNLSAAAFADRVGVQRSSISHIMSGRNKPSLDFIQKTLKSFPRVNGDWLVTGRPVSNSNKEIPSAEDSSPKAMANASDDEEKLVSASSLDKKVTREIDRIVVFYSDGTFKETIPKG